MDGGDIRLAPEGEIDRAINGLRYHALNLSEAARVASKPALYPHQVNRLKLIAEYIAGVIEGRVG